MPGKIEPATTGVWCPRSHYLGNVVNLNTGRALFCPRCVHWYEWPEVDVGKPKKQDAEKK